MYCFEAEVRLLGGKGRRQVRCGSEGEASGCMAGLRGVTGPGLHRLSCHHGRHLWCYTSCLGSVVVPCLAALGDLTCNKRATLNTMFVCLFVCLLAFLIAAGWQLVRVQGAWTCPSCVAWFCVMFTPFMFGAVCASTCVCTSLSAS